VASFAYLSGVHHPGYRRYLEEAGLVTPPAEAWFDMKREEQRVRALQAHVPPGERLLVRLFVSYPFDFKRNQIFVADFSGMAGLPPGMPIEGGAADIRRYLLSHRIRYLAYDPKRTYLLDADPQTSLSTVLHGRIDYGRQGWYHLQMKVSNAVQHTFERLAATCPHVYDDGEVYLLDLQPKDEPVSRVKI
jgi:hypothetical protein